LDLDEIAQYFVDKSVNFVISNDNRIKQLYQMRRTINVVYGALTTKEKHRLNSDTKRKFKEAKKNINKKIKEIKEKRTYGQQTISKIEELENQLLALKNDNKPMKIVKTIPKIIVKKEDSLNKLFKLENLTRRSKSILIGFAEWLSEHKVVLELLLDEHIVKLLKMYLRNKNNINLTNMQKINLGKIKRISSIYTEKVVNNEWRKIACYFMERLL